MPSWTSSSTSSILTVAASVVSEERNRRVGVSLYILSWWLACCSGLPSASHHIVHRGREASLERIVTTQHTCPKPRSGCRRRGPIIRLPSRPLMQRHGLGLHKTRPSLRNPAIASGVTFFVCGEKAPERVACTGRRCVLQTTTCWLTAWQTRAPQEDWSIHQDGLTQTECDT